MENNEPFEPEIEEPDMNDSASELMEIQELYYDAAAFIDPSMIEFFEYILTFGAISPKYGTDPQNLGSLYIGKARTPRELLARQGMHTLRHLKGKRTKRQT